MKQTQQKRDVKRPLEDSKSEAAIEGSTPSVTAASSSSISTRNSCNSSKESQIGTFQKKSLAASNGVSRGPLGDVELIFSVLLLPPSENVDQVLIFAASGLYRCTLSPFIKLEVLTERASRLRTLYKRKLVLMRR